MKANAIAKAHGWTLKEYGWWQHATKGEDIMRTGHGVWWRLGKETGHKYPSLLHAVIGIPGDYRLEEVTRPSLSTLAIIVEENADGPIGPVGIAASYAEAIELAHAYQSHNPNSWGFTIWDRTSSGAYETVANLFI